MFALPELMDLILIHLDKEDILEVVDFGVRRYPWIRKKDKSLLRACQNINTIGARYMLQHGIKTDIQEALEYSIIYGYFDLVQCLVENKTSINYNIRTSLYIGMMAHMPYLSYMIKNSYRINVALYVGEISNTLNTTENLVSNGIIPMFIFADIDDNGDGLHFTNKFGYLNIVKFLADGKTIRYSMKDYFSNTLSEMKYGIADDCIDIVKNLIKDAEHISYPIYLAILCGRPEILTYLINHR
jgi:hypothetical protein